jgi:hypothetical protein
LPQFEFEFKKFSWFYLCYLSSCGKSCLLVSWCAGDRCDITGSDEDCGRNRRPGAEDRRWSSICWVLSDRTIEMSGDTLYGFHHAPRCEEQRFFWFALKTKVDGLSVVWSQNHWVEFSGLGLKIDRYGLMIWASKSPQLFFCLCPKIKRATVYRLRHKINGRMI